jgi:transposase
VRRDKAAPNGGNKGLAKAGNARVRRGMIPLGWRFLRFQQNSTLVRWHQSRTEDRRAGTQNDDRRTGAQTAHRTLALCHEGETLEGVVLRPAG